MVRYDPERVMRVAKRITIPVMMLTAAAVAGGAIQGWAGVFLWPLAACLLVLEFVMAAFVTFLSPTVDTGMR